MYNSQSCHIDFHFMMRKFRCTYKIHKSFYNNFHGYFGLMSEMCTVYKTSVSQVVVSYDG